MSVSNVSSGYSYYQTASSHHQRKQEFEALNQALQSGDISGAQQAFSQLQQDAPSGTQSTNTDSSDGVVADISALGKALSSNDLSSAQSAFSALKSDFKNSAPPPPPSSDQSSSDGDSVKSLFGQLADALQSGNLSAAQDAFSSLQQSAPQSTDSSDNTNPFSTDLSSLSDALQSGNLSSAQSAFAQLQEDIQNAPPPPPGGFGGHQRAGDGSDQVQQAFGDLATALQNGDLNAAKSAFATLQSLSPDNQTASSSTTDSSSSGDSSTTSATTNTSSTNTLSKDMASLNDALQNGDLSSAQSLFDTLISDLQANAPRHHGVHQYQQADTTATDSSSVSTSA